MKIIQIRTRHPAVHLDLGVSIAWTCSLKEVRKQTHIEIADMESGKVVWRAEINQLKTHVAKEALIPVYHKYHERALEISEDWAEFGSAEYQIAATIADKRVLIAFYPETVEILEEEVYSHTNRLPFHYIERS